MFGHVFFNLSNEFIRIFFVCYNYDVRIVPLFGRLNERWGYF
jgi:hypothetical protein